MLKDIKDFYKNGYGVEIIDPNPLISLHNENKKEIINMFGGQKKIEIDIETTVSDREYRKILNVFSKKYEGINVLLELITKDEFLNNRITSKIEYSEEKFNKGMKVSKILKKAVNYNPYDLQTDYSMIIQKSKIVGQLVFSVDILDMLTISLNNKNWSSCLNLTDGIYRGGTYAYLLDSSTFVAYLKTNTTVINGVEIDDKQWRQLVHINIERSQALFSKNYPYESDILSTAVRENLEELLSKYKNLQNKWMLVKKMGIIRQSINDVGMTFDYNDILLSSSEEKDMSAIYHKKGSMELSVDIGIMKIPCPICGEKHIDSEDMIMCSDCDTMIKCKSCGEYNWKSYMTEDDICYECF